MQTKDTTYERIDPTTDTVEVITLLDVRPTAHGNRCFATVAIETIRGGTVTETIDVMTLAEVPPSVLSAYFGG